MHCFSHGEAPHGLFSINLPINGTNSWRLFFFEMKSVNLVRNCFSLSCFVDKYCLNLSTWLATAILSSYFQGRQMVPPLVPNVPFKSEQFSFDTFANEEKNLALFNNSPPQHSKHFHVIRPFKFKSNLETLNYKNLSLQVSNFLA